MIKNSIVWIRDDFRLQDNPALSFATNNHAHNDQPDFFTLDYQLPRWRKLLLENKNNAATN